VHNQRKITYGKDSHVNIMASRSHKLKS